MSDYPIVYIFVNGRRSVRKPQREPRRALLANPSQPYGDSGSEKLATVRRFCDIVYTSKSHSMCGRQLRVTDSTLSFVALDLSRATGRPTVRKRRVHYK